MSQHDQQPVVFFSRQSMGAVPWILSSKVLLFFAYFGISVLIVRGLGKETYGVFALLKNIADVLVILCGLGMNAAIVRFVPELLVQRNRAGLIRLLWKSAMLQAGLTFLAVLVMVPLTPYFDRWFGVEFGHLLVLMAISVAFVLAKSWYNDVMTSLYLGKWVAMTSLVQGFTWAAMLGWLIWRQGATVTTVLLVETVSIVLSGGMAAIILRKHLRSLNFKSPPAGIGKQRVLDMGLATWGGSIGRAFMMKYTEIFFLGLYCGPAVVAVYDLGYSSTMLVITFIPMALQTLFASGLAEAYVKDPDCLPRLVGSLYKVLILLAVPVSAFGVFFASDAVVVFYGPSMAEAGWIASWFCALHLLPLIAIPMSMAIGVKEKVKAFLPVLFFRVGVNLFLDWLLIPHYGVAGALAAVFLTFLLTFPLRLGRIRSVLGGFHFPTGFFLRFAVFCPLLAGALRWGSPWHSLAGLCGAALVYFSLFFLLLRFARLLRHDDVAELRGLGFRKLNLILGLLVGKST